MVAIATLALVVRSALATADDVAVPHFNLDPVCRGIAQQGGLDLEPNQSVQQTFASCVRSEVAVRGQVVKQWSIFKASDKSNCIGEANAGGMPSYSDLLTCLQMARDVSKISQ
jgi:hypothetical protein